MPDYYSRANEVPTPRVVTIARLVEKKGEYGIRAAAQVLTERPLSYTIVCDGPDRPQLQSLIENPGVSGHVRIVGWSDHGSIRDILHNAEIVMQPSVTSAGPAGLICHEFR